MNLKLLSYFKIFRLNLTFIPRFWAVWSRVLLLELKEESLRRCIKDMREYRKNLMSEQIAVAYRAYPYDYPVVQVDGKYLCDLESVNTDLHIARVVVVPGKIVNLVTVKP